MPKSFLWGLFWTSGYVSSGFQSLGSLIHTWQRWMCYTFPDIHLWCDTCWPLGGQHGSWANFFHIPASRHWWGSKPWPIVLQTNVLPTELCRLGINIMPWYVWTRWLNMRCNSIWNSLRLFTLDCTLNCVHWLPILLPLGKIMCRCRKAVIRHW